MTSATTGTAEPIGQGGHPPMQVAARTLGEILLTLGVVLLLFVGYQLFWTNVVADRAAQAHVDDLATQWESTPEGEEFDLPLVDGEPFALMRIPALGARFQAPVVEGVTLADLAEGVGHYPGTALPGEVGNFAVAGHRATNGEPFARLDVLGKGDAVVVETATRWYTYRVRQTRIVEPTQVDVILPVPGRPQAEPTRELLTLTTCNPRWASYERLIVHAELTDRRAKGDGPPPALREG